jgi:hypothetical protein
MLIQGVFSIRAQIILTQPNHKQNSFAPFCFPFFIFLLGMFLLSFLLLLVLYYYCRNENYHLCYYYY